MGEAAGPGAGGRFSPRGHHDNAARPGGRWRPDRPHERLESIKSGNVHFWMFRRMGTTSSGFPLFKPTEKMYKTEHIYLGVSDGELWCSFLTKSVQCPLVWSKLLGAVMDCSPSYHKWRAGAAWLRRHDLRGLCSIPSAGQWLLRRLLAVGNPRGCFLEGRGDPASAADGGA